MKKWSKIPWNFVKGSFFIKLTKLLGWHHLPHLLHNFLKNDQNGTKLCKRYFLYKMDKNNDKKQWWNSGLRSPCKLGMYLFCNWVVNGFKSRITRYLLTVGSFRRFPGCFNLLVLFFSCNSMPCSGCSALHVVN